MPYKQHEGYRQSLLATQRKWPKYKETTIKEEQQSKRGDTKPQNRTYSRGERQRPYKYHRVG